MSNPQNDPVAEALKKLFDAFPSGPLGVDVVGLSECNGRILANDIAASVDSPPFSRALVEGYLVNLSDTTAAGENNSVTLAVKGMIEPGKTYTEGLPAGSCMEVSTGSFVPEGDYAVVKQMDVTRREDNIAVKRSLNKGDNIESRGCEIKKDEVILRVGTRLSPKEIMLLAGQGISSLGVARKPIVAIYSSGNEVIRPSEPLKPGYVWDANSYTLSALTEEYGGIPLVVDIMKDDFDVFQKALRAGLTRADMAVISGGTAVGGKEFIVELINSLDEPGVVVNGVPMRSGKPLIMGVVAEKPVVCVAGYPPEAIRGFELFGKPTIARLLSMKRS